MGTRSEHVLEIRRGEGSPMSMRLRPGTRVEPTSFGRVAAWTIDGSGVFDVHGYVYWDGEGLFVQSADGRDPVRANGVPVGESWTPIAAPTTLSFGDVRIAFAQENERAPTTSVRPAAGGRAPARSLPPQRPTRPPPSRKPTTPARDAAEGDAEDERTRAFMPRVDVPARPEASPDYDPGDDENTRMQMPAVVPPSDDDHTKIVPLPATRPRAAPMPAPAPPAPVAAPISAPMPVPSAPAVIVAPEVLAPPRAPIATAPIAVPPAAATTTASIKPDLFGKLKSDWSELSLPKKLILFLMPLAFVMVFIGFDDEPSPPPKKNAPAMSAASSSGKGHAKADDDDAPKSKKKKRHHDDDDDDDDPKPAQGTPKVAAASDAGVAAPNVDAGASVDDASSDAPGVDPSTSADAGPKTMERAAADAVAAGDNVGALKLYKQLLKANPTDDGYKEAVRILRGKIASEGRRRKRDDE